MVKNTILVKECYSVIERKIKMLEYIYPIITAAISGMVTYLVARNGNKKDIEVVKIQNKAEIDRLVNQHAIDIESMKEKHKLELESKEKEHQYKLELIKAESENEITKQNAISGNEAVNNLVVGLMGSIFGSEAAQKEIEKGIKEAFKNKEQ
ncbi:MAG: hypothetical protein IKL68_01060 [Clostridia bacterium]|nr:hypothetical protein [Clostridia bacterium]